MLHPFGSLYWVFPARHPRKAKSDMGAQAKPTHVESIGIFPRSNVRCAESILSFSHIMFRGSHVGVSNNAWTCLIYLGVASKKPKHCTRWVEFMQIQECLIQLPGSN